MIYLVLVGSIVGYSAYVYALKYLPVSTVSLYAYVNPIIAVVLGTLLLSEPFSLRIVRGLGAGLRRHRDRSVNLEAGCRRTRRREERRDSGPTCPARPCKTRGRAA